MKYYYKCNKEDNCKLSDATDEIYDNYLICLREKWIEFNEEGDIDFGKTPLIWEVNHPMKESPELQCPVCESKAQRLISASAFFFKGNCYLDKSGCHRDMNLFNLQEHDPYGYMRQPGEADDLADRIRKRGKFSTNKKHYVLNPKGGYYRKN